MATDARFIEYVRDQLAGAGVVSYRKMFGEYAVYCDGKVVALACDNQLFVKPTAPGRASLAGMAGVTEEPPYPGARPWLLVSDLLDDRPQMVKLVRLTAAALPLPKPKPKERAK